jgi:UPF0755 protein
VRRIVGWTLLVVLLLAAAGAAWLALGVTRPFKGYSEPERFVEVPQGAGPASIGRRLVDAGIIRDSLTFRFELARSGAGRRLQAGEYRFDRPMTVKEVVAKIARGDVYLLPITFREGLTIKQMSEIFEARGFGPASEFVAAAGDGGLAAAFDPGAGDLEGYLFPDTYALPRRASAAQLVARMVAGFERALTPELRARAAARGLDVRRLVTLASIVEKETGIASERPAIAGVFVRRLQLGMRLQTDPTVIYGMGARYAGNIHKKDLLSDTPYNTYTRTGLPPTPIALPGRAALTAATHPAAGDALYFVAIGDGSGRHVFTRSFAEHEAAVRQYLQRYRAHETAPR